MENIRTKRAKKPNPKYADSDYETIAALRRPSKQAKLDRRSSLLSEKETPSHDGTLNSMSSTSEEEESITSNDSSPVHISIVEDIKVEVGDAEDEAIPINNGKNSPVFVGSNSYKKEEIISDSPDTFPTIKEITSDLSNVNGSSNIEQLPNSDMMSSILGSQVNMNKRLDKIENQISKILEILDKKQQKSSTQGQSKIQNIKDSGLTNILKKKSNK